MKINAILLMDPGTHTAYFQNRNPERRTENKNWQLQLSRSVHCPRPDIYVASIQ